MREWLQNAAMKATDWIMACIPRAVPSQLALRNCKIISHRGEHDNNSIIENTPSGIIANLAKVKLDRLDEIDVERVMEEDSLGVDTLFIEPGDTTLINNRGNN